MYIFTSVLFGNLRQIIRLELVISSFSIHLRTCDVMNISVIIYIQSTSSSFVIRHHLREVFLYFLHIQQGSKKPDLKDLLAFSEPPKKFSFFSPKNLQIPSFFRNFAHE